MLNCLPLLSLCLAFAGLASGDMRMVNNLVARQASGPDPFQFTNVNGGDNKDIYVGTIVVGGQSFEVQLDTGSSDLWLDTAGLSTAGFTSTGDSGSITYGDMTVAEGPILIGNVTFGPFTVPQQAFISAPGTNATTDGDKGLLGLGPNGLSTVLQSLNGSSYNGNSFLDNVFTSYTQDANFITFSLSRSDLGVTAGGSFTISNIPDQFSAISNSASLLVLDPTGSTPQWACALDDVVVQGQHLNSQGSALFDTGTSLSSAPSSVVDSMYGSIPGAQFDSAASAYSVPCDSQIDISFIFSGVSYPVHPIDATFVTVADDGTVVCMGAFSYNDPASSGVDFILGDSFLRNVFAQYDFGVWTTVGSSPPFVKLLSTTDVTKADAEFASLNQMRLSQAQGATQKTSSTDEKAASSSASNAGSSVDISTMTRNTYIIMGLLCGVIFMLFILAAAVIMTRGNKGYRAVATTSAPAPYKPFHDQTAYPQQYSRTSMDDKYRDT